MQAWDESRLKEPHTCQLFPSAYWDGPDYT
jgi:hypothetical protein